MSFGRYLEFKTVKWTGIILMMVSLPLILPGLALAPSYYLGYFSSGNSSYLISGILLLVVGWLAFQYGCFKEMTQIIATGVKEEKHDEPRRPTRVDIPLSVAPPVPPPVPPPVAPSKDRSIAQEYSLTTVELNSSIIKLLASKGSRLTEQEIIEELKENIPSIKDNDVSVELRELTNEGKVKMIYDETYKKLRFYVK